MPRTGVDIVELEEHLFLFKKLLALFVDLQASFLVAFYCSWLGFLLLLLLHPDLIYFSLK